MVTTCKICERPVRALGEKWGAFLRRDFHFVRCDTCGFVAVEDPSTEFAKLYDESYYEGRGADPSVDYGRELSRPDRVVRVYEWRGILELVKARVGDLAGKRWLDYGSGAGGLVRFARDAGVECVGVDTGAYAKKARAAGVPMVSEDEIASMSGAFDVVTLVEVLEHVIDPIPFLERIAALLRPGGLLFLTTGNAQAHAKKFFDWSYVVPEIHVSFYTPRALTLAFERVGLSALPGAFGPGWSDILRFKILKGLRVHERSPLEAALPWPLLTRLADRRFQASAHPLGVKR